MTLFYLSIFCPLCSLEKAAIDFNVPIPLQNEATAAVSLSPIVLSVEVCLRILCKFSHSLLLVHLYNYVEQPLII